MGVISNGTTLLDAGALDSGVATGSMILLSTSTASSSATIDITSGIDSTYKEYCFKFINIHPATYQARFAFQADTGTNTNYNQTMTTSWFYAYHQEDGNSGSSAYFGDADQAQGTSFQNITWNVDNSNDDKASSLSEWTYYFLISYQNTSKSNDDIRENEILDIFDEISQINQKYQTNDKSSPKENFNDINSFIIKSVLYLFHRSSNE